MPAAERPERQAYQIFRQALFGIGASEVGVLPEKARRTLDRLGRNQLAVATANLVMPGMTGFEFSMVPGQGLTPTLLFNAGRLLGANERVVQGDLARTVAIVDQSPFNGYQRRYTEVYGDAIDQQRAWLEGAGSPQVPFDPRNMEREELLRSVLGEAKYLSDVGFADWQQEIDEYEGPQVPLSVLGQLKNDSTKFLLFREKYVPDFYQLGTIQLGDEYLSRFTQDERTKIAAGFLVQLALQAEQSDPLI